MDEKFTASVLRFQDFFFTCSQFLLYMFSFFRWVVFWIHFSVTAAAPQEATGIHLKKKSLQESILKTKSLRVSGAGIVMSSFITFSGFHRAGQNVMKTSGFHHKINRIVGQTLKFPLFLRKLMNIHAFFLVFVMDLDGFHQKRAGLQPMTSSDDKRQKN